jgi:hypothetical protein
MQEQPYLWYRLRRRVLSAGRRGLIFLTIVGVAATVFGFAYIFVARATPGLEIAPGLLGAIVGAILGFVSNLILAVQRSFEEGRVTNEKIQGELPRIPKRRSSQNYYSTH